MSRPFRIIDSADPELWTCAGSHSGSWRVTECEIHDGAFSDSIELVSRRLLCEYLHQPVDVGFVIHLLCHVASSCNEASTVKKVSLARAAPAGRLHPHLLVSVSGGR